VTIPAEGGAVPARDARSGPARDRPAEDPARPANPRAGRIPGHPSARRGSGAPRGGEPSGAAPADALVVGAVPLAARVAGALLVLAGLTAVAGLFSTYLVVGGTEVSLVTGIGSALVALVVPVTHLAVGGVLTRGTVPKFGLAYAAVAAALATGALLIELYRGSSSTARPGVEVLAGQRVVTSTVDVGAGWVLGVVSLALTVLAGLCAAAAWGRTVMEDNGTLDPVRSALAGGAVLVGWAPCCA
jgi:hypothetical protein